MEPQVGFIDFPIAKEYVEDGQLPWILDIIWNELGMYCEQTGAQVLPGPPHLIEGAWTTRLRFPAIKLVD